MNKSYQSTSAKARVVAAIAAVVTVFALFDFVASLSDVDGSRSTPVEASAAHAVAASTSAANLVSAA